MKEILAIIGIICALIVGTSIALPEESWLFVYGNRAEAHSKKLLLGETLPTPDWATNMVVNMVDGIVTYGNHGNSTVFAFSPKGVPQLYGVEWENMWGDWYVTQIKT